jgi:hypothetical protein
VLSSAGSTAAGTVLHPVTGTVTTLPRPVTSVLRARSADDRLEPTVRAVFVLGVPHPGTVWGGAMSSGMPLVATAMRTATARGPAWQEVVPDGWPAPG